MKIAFINAVCRYSSTGKNTIISTNRMKKYGFDVKVFYGIKHEENSLDDPNEYVYFGNKFLFTLDHIVSNITGLSASLANWQTNKLFKMLDEYKPDIIWLYNIHGGYVNEFRLLEYCKKNAKWTVYGMADEYAFLGKCCYSYDCEKFMYERGCYQCPQRRESPRSLIFDNSHYMFKKKEKVYKDFHTITFSSAPYVVAKAKKSWLLRDKDFFQKDASVDVENIYFPRNTTLIREELGIAKTQRVVMLCAGFSQEYKGTIYFHQAAKLCEDVDDLVFVNVGFDGDATQCPKNMITIPYVKDQNRLAELLSLADAYVCTSIADAQPNACLNALGCGTPIIGFNISGVPYVASEEFGTFVEPFDLNALVEAIKSVPHKDEIRISECHKYALARFGSAAGERRHIQQFDHVINMIEAYYE